jgi:NADP-dependent aldehyde dehydrogenase
VAGLASAVVADHGFPEGTFAVVHGTAAGVRVLQAPAVRAAGFTGSVRGGRALEQVAQSRPDPIPFYGELGSTNPVVVTPAAVAERGAEIAAGYVGSFTLGTGQFCTKPSVLFLPAGHGLDDVLREQVAGVAATPMLTESIREAFGTGRDSLAARPDVTVLAGGDAGDGTSAGPVLLRVDAATWLRDHAVLGEEVFGPLSLVVEYAERSELLAVLDVLEGSLAATVHLADDDEPWVATVLDVLAARTGRLLVNGWPTGVAVTWAMQHGGPHPVTTNALHTSVGVTAVRRWLRPVTYQSVPAALLPPALRDDNPWRLPRRVDGVLEAAPTS